MRGWFGSTSRCVTLLDLYSAGLQNVIVVIPRFPANPNRPELFDKSSLLDWSLLLGFLAHESSTTELQDFFCADSDVHSQIDFWSPCPGYPGRVSILKSCQPESWNIWERVDPRNPRLQGLTNHIWNRIISYSGWQGTPPSVDCPN